MKYRSTMQSLPYIFEVVHVHNLASTNSQKIVAQLLGQIQNCLGIVWTKKSLFSGEEPTLSYKSKMSLSDLLCCVSCNLFSASFLTLVAERYTLFRSHMTQNLISWNLENERLFWLHKRRDKSVTQFQMDQYRIYEFGDKVKSKINIFSLDVFSLMGLMYHVLQLFFLRLPLEVSSISYEAEDLRWRCRPHQGAISVALTCHLDWLYEYSML